MSKYYTRPLLITDFLSSLEIRWHFLLARCFSLPCTVCQLLLIICQAHGLAVDEADAFGVEGVPLSKQAISLLPSCCSLSVAHYFLLHYWRFTHYLLLTTSYLLLTTSYSLLATHYWLLTTCYSLLTTCYSLFAAHYLLLTTC